ncbi:hypothetical protein KGF54_000462 [Candida jiufengensis]|uniref:uncharacterized protein n=1 Tax=Candida jiufengensis TaxID=497108 RepID=UPI00222553D9|nr:uncharacterized protein KGF54_000462 [Candida jiufengensis]KAI5956844.1 hypothetical protein KGF54_000462 [Candida jiufengensis]
MSDSEDEEIFESLMATRARRTNAGSRLKQLIELEEQTNESQDNNQFVTEDDENVNLLFQDDEDDQEFIDEELDNENLAGIDEDEEEENEDEENNNESTTKKRRHGDSDIEEEEEEVNLDEQLSDSDISASDSDASEGERELQKQERVRKKRKKTIIPAIKKVNTKPPAPKKKSPLVTSDSLLMSNRRSSSRSAAVESKQALVDRLIESEKRKAKYVYVERKKAKEPTQEERMAQAIETEKENIESLNKFKEQEIVKKERQRQSLLSKRKPMKNILRVVSKEAFIRPQDEVDEARREFFKRKRRIKRKAGNGEEEIEPFSINYSSPYQQRLLAERKKLMEVEIDKVEAMNINLMEKLIDQKKTEPANNVESSVKGVKLESIDDEKQNENKDEIEELSTKSVSDKEIVKDQLATTEANNGVNISLKQETQNGNEAIEIGQDDTNTKEIDGEGQNVKKEFDSEKGMVDSKEEVVPSTNNKDEKDIIMVQEEIVHQNGIVEIETKKVKFADDIIEPQSVDASPQPEEIKLESPPQPEIFEGPVQRICRNLVSFINFDEDRRDLRLNPINVRTMLFGKQSLLPAKRRFNDGKTILHIGKTENPYAITQTDNSDDLFASAYNLTEDDPMFDELKKLPRLGVQHDIIEVEEDTQENENTEIKITTEAPTGLYLPNGNKKLCMISGTEVKYFDPQTGMPYSSVETYRLLKSIEQGQASWLSLNSDVSTNGPFDLYLGFKGENNRSAKGVPDGFDG